MKIKDYFGEKGTKDIKDRIDQFLDGENGFIFICTENPNKVTDAYKGYCAKHVLGIVKKQVEDAVKKELL